MASKAFNWTCPHCNHAIVVAEANYRTGMVALWVCESSGTGELSRMHVEVIDCPNQDCGKSTVTFGINMTAYPKYLGTPNNLEYGQSKRIKRKWMLIPQSDAKSYPDCVPEAVRADYVEACLVRDLSPKAAATLARRCLQGMIRDFHGVVKNRLVDEIEAIKDKVDGDVWEAIDAVRHLGNIGAHMEKDVNVMLKVEPEEAVALIRLIEMLIEEWYLARQKRNERVASVKRLAEAKQALKEAGRQRTTDEGT